MVVNEVVLEGGRQIRPIVEWRLVQQAPVIDEVAHHERLAGVEDVVHAGEPVVVVAGAQRVEPGGLRGKAEHGCLYSVDGRDVVQHHGIVVGRLAAALAFVVGKNKGLVLLEGPADGGAKLVLAQSIQAGRSEDALRVHHVVAEVFIHCAVPVVRAAFGDDVYDAAHGAAKIRRVVRVDDAEFLHGILRRCSTLDPRDRGDVVGTVHGDEIEVDVLTGEGKLGNRLDDDVGAARSGVANLHGGREQSKINELAPVDGQVFNLPLLDDRAHLCARRLC